MQDKVFDQCVILNNQVAMPWLGLGVWRVADGQEVENSVRWALEAGYRSIDTAMIYENEAGVGKALAQSGVPRDEIFVTTKVWNDDQGYESTLRAYEESRRRLGLERLDLYLVHWPIERTYRETWRALVHLYKEGYVRAIGVSNFRIRHIDAILEDTGVVPAVNQVQLHPLSSQKELLRYASGHGIRLTAWSPLMKGKLDIPLLTELAAKYKKTPAQIILRWDYQNGVIVIPKSIRKERIIENSGFFDFTLSAEDMAAIDGLNTDTHFGLTPEAMNERYE